MRGSQRGSFRGSSSSSAIATRGRANAQERRHDDDRRNGEDRRAFPRPEGRRMGGGRRGGDPVEV
ncbi:MAG TPA: hypothetical protein VF407_19495 [Polyangiaceae bacterium]